KATGIAIDARVYAIKVLSSSGMGTEASLIAGIEWAIDNNVDIINMSLGSDYASEAEEEICSIAYEQGMSIVAAAGNDGIEKYSYPASYPMVVSVAAVDQDNNRAYFSNKNDMLSIAAPGVDIYSALPNNEYGIYSGTSMATPHCTGSLAIAKEYYLNLGKKNPSNEYLETVMQSTALPKNDYNSYGAGILQAYDLLKAIENEMLRKK
ncbi:MAG: S8 family serine peptidase, partial [Candidatus Woesearchaeota archaeon]